MKKFLKYFIVMVAVMTTTLSFSSCSKDDDEPAAATSGNIVGTWVSTETYTENSVTYTQTYTVNFQSNGTGFRKNETVASTGASSSDMYTFRYTYATQSNGTLLVTLIDDDDQYSQKWNVTQTGNTMLVDNRVYTRQ